MDFETWWEKIEDRFLYGREAAEAAWQAAQEAERRRIYQILDRVAIDANHKEWDACCYTIKDRINALDT